MGGIDGIESELAHVAVENGKKETSVNGHVGEIDSGEPLDDQSVKAKLYQADKDLRKRNLARDLITEKLRAKRTERAQVISQLKELVEEKNRFRTIMDGKRKEIEPLQQALGKLQGPKNDSRDNRNYICSSEEELNAFIKSITLNEEKQIIREIKKFDGTRDKVIVNAAMRAEVQKSVGEKDVIQDQVRLIGVDLNEPAKINRLLRQKLRHSRLRKRPLSQKNRLNKYRSFSALLKLIQKGYEDSEANVKRLKPAGIWDIIVEILKWYELRDKFESNEDWIMLGTKFRKLVKPLDITNY
ncbi:proton pump-interactor 1-like protein [Tanacetum coccineum]